VANPSSTLRNKTAAAPFNPFAHRIAPRYSTRRRDREAVIGSACEARREVLINFTGALRRRPSVAGYH